MILDAVTEHSLSMHSHAGVVGTRIPIFPRHSCVRRNPVAEFAILHSVAGRRMIKSVLDQLLCSGYFLLLRLRLHSHAGAWERRKHAIWECLLWLFSGFLRAQE